MAAVCLVSGVTLVHTALRSLYGKGRPDAVRSIDDTVASKQAKKSARDGNTLLLTAGKVPRMLLSVFGETDAIKKFKPLGFRLATRSPEYLLLRET